MLREYDGEKMGILGLRHRPSGVNARFAGKGWPFADYVSQTQAMLRQLHEGKNEAERIVTGNSPFELHPAGDYRQGRDKPCRRGVLLTHGLTDSPYHMRHLAAFFQRNGFRVMAVLLPGHGTQPGDLLEMHRREWAAAVAYGADCLAAEADEIYLAGFSAGAALSVLQAVQDLRVRGLFLFSPAFEITPLARWANLHKLYSWLMPAAAWVSVMQDKDLYKYESFCKNAAAQMHALTQALPQCDMDIPVFAAASADDATVMPAATLRFMQRARHPCSRLVWYSTEKIERRNVEWVDSAIPERRILSSAHTAIVMPPDDPHYGAAGDYANCLHYCEKDGERYRACMTQPQDAWLGEVDPQYLGRGLLRRLMYNPHYAAMEASMQRFIEELP
ncbi:carboxylesterase [Sideroxyarcus emersonii]|uniref:alpha/beta hydrolase n=1 Tax=Sideroxyarcus emersonii TaxID=2764705 RepID=UPI001F31FF75|nr:alpha/beta fold hydrolase [Sideroxyarcus emersonii]